MNEICCVIPKTLKMATTQALGQKTCASHTSVCAHLDWSVTCKQKKSKL